jgi:hypothetical protein
MNQEFSTGRHRIFGAVHHSGVRDGDPTALDKDVIFVT